jgi:hypothetical protein
MGVRPLRHYCPRSRFFQKATCPDPAFDAFPAAAGGAGRGGVLHIMQDLRAFYVLRPATTCASVALSDLFTGSVEPRVVFCVLAFDSRSVPPYKPPPRRRAADAAADEKRLRRNGFLFSIGLFDIVIEGRGTWAAARLPFDGSKICR